MNSIFLQTSFSSETGAWVFSMLLESILPDATQEYLDYVSMKALSKHGNWGRASEASKAKGEQELTARSAGIVSYVKETIRKPEELESTTSRRSIIPEQPKK